jgi:heterogeneous nuclear ribonucleoprotein F/H
MILTCFYLFSVLQQQWQEQQRDPPTQTAAGGEQEKVGVDAVWGSVGMPAPVQDLNTQAGIEGRQGRGGGPMDVPMMGGRGGGPDQGAMPGGAQAKRSGGGIQVGEHTGFLRMRGLPFSASKEDISKFFAAYNPILESIVLTFRSDGRATGEAYVGFETAEDSKNAMDLHRKSMGSRYIELFLSNKEEHGRALARFGNR